MSEKEERENIPSANYFHILVPHYKLKSRLREQTLSGSSVFFTEKSNGCALLEVGVQVTKSLASDEWQSGY